MASLSAGLVPFSLLLANPFAAQAISSDGIFITHLENVLGTSLTLKVVASCYADARRAEAAVLAEVDRLTQVLSSYLPDSEFNQWLRSAGQSVPVSPDLWQVLSLFDTWQARTNGVLNAATDGISQLWQQASELQIMPSEQALSQMVAQVQQRHWQRSEHKQEATRLGNTSLRLHTFTKSYVLDRAAEAALGLPGVQGVVLNGGGDVVIRGNWTEPMAVADPHADAENAPVLARLAVRDAAVATSGSYRRGVQVGYSWYSHLIDPRSGRPADKVASATVVHPDAVTAGALATAFAILPPADSVSLATTIPDAQYLIVSADGQHYASSGWVDLTLPGVSAPLVRLPVNLLSVPVKDKLWNPKQELVISLELPRLEGRSHRPFVAVWVEDANHKPVRQLALWYNKPKWLRDLRTWYAQDIDATSVTSATRSSGSYTLSWDGKDDKGQYVKLGKYTICLEAAREHGTYQLIRQEMDFNGKPKQKTLTGNVEISSAALDYHEKPATR